MDQPVGVVREPRHNDMKQQRRLLQLKATRQPFCLVAGLKAHFQIPRRIIKGSANSKAVREPCFNDVSAVNTAAPIEHDPPTWLDAHLWDPRENFNGSATYKITWQLKQMVF